MIARRKHSPGARLLPAACAMIGLCAASAAEGPALAQEKPADVLAAAVRTQGFPCDKPLSAEREGQAAADQPVWILRCDTGAYRVRLSANRTAQVERIQ